MTKRAKGKTGLLIVISGPSGVGKSTVVSALIESTNQLKLSVSATTRPVRPGEKEGRDYCFINQEDFSRRVRQSEFIEWAKVHGYYYGTPRKFVQEELSRGQVVILEVDVQGAAAVKEILTKGKIKAAGAVFIFLIPPSVDILATRLEKRKTESAPALNKRLRAAIQELAVMEKYDYIVVNDQVESAAQKIAAVINVEKERILLN